MRALLGLAALALLVACSHPAPPLGRAAVRPAAAPTSAPTTPVDYARVARLVASRGTRRTTAVVTRRPTHTYGVERWRWLVARYAWPVDTALAVMGCESGGDENAVGPWTPHGRAHGLMQVMNGPMDPVANVELAFRMWQDRHWGPWQSSQFCWGAS